MANKNEYVIKAKTGFKTVKITDGNEVLGTFRFNPADSNLISRAEEVNAFMRDLKIPENTDEQADALVNVCNTIAEKIDYLLGCKVSDSVFSVLGPLSIMEDGQLFFEFLLDQIGDIINTVTEERLKNKMERVAAATAEYADAPVLAPLA